MRFRCGVLLLLFFAIGIFFVNAQCVPYNATSSNLTIEMGNLSCQHEPNVGINDKEYCIAHIPFEYLNESFKCLAMITKGETCEIIQTTPEYKEVPQTFFNIYPNADTRQFFEPANSIVNFYYTGKNLNPENDYILAIECSSSARTLRSEMAFQIAYEDVSFVFFRTRWLMANTSYLIAGIFVAFIILLLLVLLWKNAK